MKEIITSYLAATGLIFIISLIIKAYEQLCIKIVKKRNAKKNARNVKYCISEDQWTSLVDEQSKLREQLGQVREAIEEERSERARIDDETREGCIDYKEFFLNIRNLQKQLDELKGAINL